MNLDELINYIKKNVDEGDFIEIHAGRVMVEGYLEKFDEGYIKISHEKFGYLEFELENIFDDLLEFVHIKEGKRIVIKFY
ncbi:DUF2097 family protein [Methanocaldococcus sp.]